MKTLILSFLLVGAATIAQADLTPAEQAFSKGLNATARARYTTTREYFHRAAAIVNKTADPISLGRKPKDFDAKYLGGDEASIIAKARNLSNDALLSGISVSTPTSSGRPAATGVLTADERAFSKTLDVAARERYKATREYLHKAVAIVNKTADPASFGHKPKAFDPQYLKGDEASIITQARDLSNIALMRGIKIGK